MWTLFDPLANLGRSEFQIGQTKKPAGSQTASTQTVFERLWCLLEPTGPLSCKSEPPDDKRS